MFISTATSHDEADRAATVAVLPVGSFEQHGGHLPLSTDTLVACAIARRLTDDHDLLLLPPITISCSHEHAGFAGSVSISSSTLCSIVRDVLASLEQAGIPNLVVANCHGGNYALANVVQEANLGRRRMLLFPRNEDWNDARNVAGLETDTHDDMHGGEAETSILLAVAPEVVRSSYVDADFDVHDRRYLLTTGISGYTKTGIIGRPSLASAEKGEALLRAFSSVFQNHLAQLQ